MTDVYRAVLKLIDEKYPAIATAVSQEAPSPLLFSHFHVDLSLKDVTTIETFVTLIEKIKNDARFEESLQLPDIARFHVGNESIFTCFDFHITPTGPKLIEINTNASLYIWAALMTEVRKQELNVYGSDHVEKIRIMLEADIELSGLTQPRIAIMDEIPKEQRAYAEFLAYQSLFESWGYKTLILDPKDLRYKQGRVFSAGDAPLDFIYNRHTDFYLESEVLKPLAESYLSESVVLSPNPREYGLIADKGRLIDLRSFHKGLSTEEIQLLQNVIPECGRIKDLPNKEEKKQRQRFFFKPLRSHGGKAVYSGESISNRLYEEIMEKEYLYQEIVPPPIVNRGGADWKWDLRVYTYAGTVQMMIGRMYQGQTTNTRVEGGGGAVVQVV